MWGVRSLAKGELAKGWYGEQLGVSFHSSCKAKQWTVSLPQGSEKRRQRLQLGTPQLEEDGGTAALQIGRILGSLLRNGEVPVLLPKPTHSNPHQQAHPPALHSPRQEAEDSLETQSCLRKMIFG
jgi:hypothetical protein